MEKIKQFIESDMGKDILTVLVVILVGLGSFGLGRLSVRDDNKGLNIEYSEAVTASAVLAQNPSLSTTEIQKSLTSGEKAFFASSRGSKYYPLGCSAGKTIKLENRIYFGTADEAEKAGYTRSTSCK